MKSKRGSALITAIILSAIMLLVLAALLTTALSEYRSSMRSYFDTAAFNLAEAGVDRAAAFIVQKGYDSATSVEPTGTPTEAGVWYKKTDGATVVYYRGYFASVDLDKNRKGTCSVIVKPGVVNGSTTTYSVYTLGTVRGGEGGSGLVSQRAINVELESSATSGGGRGAGVAAKTTLDFGSGANENYFDADRNARLLVASYDSQKNDGRGDIHVDRKTGKVTGLNFGDDAVVGLKAVNGTAHLYSALIYGTVAVGGAAGTLSVESNPKKGCSPTEWRSQNPYVCSVVDLNAAQNYYTPQDGVQTINPYMGYNLDRQGTGGLGDNVAYNYQFDDDLFALTGFTTDKDGKTVFDTTGYKEENARNATGQPLPAQNANVSKTVLGPEKYDPEKGARTYTKLENVSGLGEILVKGDAVLFLSGTANLTNGDGIMLSFADSTSKLTIVAQDMGQLNIRFKNGDNNISNGDNLDPTNNKSGVGYSPDRLVITSSGSTQVKLDIGNGQNAAAIVRVPNGSIEVVCQDNNTSNQFRGQLIADRIGLSGSTYLDILYDINLSKKGSTKTGITLGGWRQILPSAFNAQL
ncbi:MAG TPA: hypothetical protein VK178_16650 [Opitutaceae bacterium]|nr:hypothetical protein [Opitutaceae bacterium]